MPPPKVLLFDIGGVCVVSPFQAILDYEHTHSIPPGYINFAISFSKPRGAWHTLERGLVPLDQDWYESWQRDLESPSAWTAFHKKYSNQREPTSVPPVPSINAEELYWLIMGKARANDPYMAPALFKLKSKGKYRLAALSNTSIFPDGHEFNMPHDNDVRSVFEVFVSSAHVGMRKPDREIYDYTLGELRKKWPSEEIQAGDVLFFDDIGENLRMARQVGFQTVKVHLGRTREAVRILEEVTGEKLCDNLPGESAAKARL